MPFFSIVDTYFLKACPILSKLYTKMEKNTHKVSWKIEVYIYNNANTYQNVALNYTREPSIGETFYRKSWTFLLHSFYWLWSFLSKLHLLQRQHTYKCVVKCFWNIVVVLRTYIYTVANTLNFPTKKDGYSVHHKQQKAYIKMHIQKEISSIVHCKHVLYTMQYFSWQISWGNIVYLGKSSRKSINDGIH